MEIIAGIAKGAMQNRARVVLRFALLCALLSCHVFTVLRGNELSGQRLTAVYYRNVFYWFFFYALGNYAAVKEILPAKGRFIPCAVLFCLAIAFMQGASETLPNLYFGYNSFGGLLVTILGIAALFHCPPDSGPIRFLGRHSYTIFLSHILFTTVIVDVPHPDPALGVWGAALLFTAALAGSLLIVWGGAWANNVALSRLLGLPPAGARQRNKA